MRFPDGAQQKSQRENVEHRKILAETAASDSGCLKSAAQPSLSRWPAGYHIYCLPRPLIEIPSDDWYCSACSDAHARSVDLPYRVGCELRYRTEPGIWATGIAESMGPKGVRLHCPSAYNDVGDDWVPVDSGRLKPAVKKADEQEEFFAYEYDDSCMVCSHHKLKSWRLGSFIPTLTSMAITVSLSVCFLTPPPWVKRGSLRTRG